MHVLQKGKLNLPANSSRPVYWLWVLWLGSSPLIRSQLTLCFIHIMKWYVGKFQEAEVVEAVAEVVVAMEVAEATEVVVMVGVDMEVAMGVVTTVMVMVMIILLICQFDSFS